MSSFLRSHSTQTITGVSLLWSRIGNEGAQCFVNALKINKVRKTFVLAFLTSKTSIQCRHSQS
jgi:hypothetical protein